MTSEPPSFRDLSGLATALKGALAVFIATAAVGLWSGWLEADLLERMLADEPFTMEEAEANDTRQLIIGIVYGLAYLTTAFLFLRWTYLANRNARALGAEQMQYTPGWAVGWYFVPIATLWKPYQAMVETFKASHPRFDDDWSLAPRPAVLSLWWSMWILTTFLAQVIFRLALGAEEIDDLLTSTRLTLASDALDLPLGLVVIAMVAKLQQWQTVKAQRLPTVLSPPTIEP